MTSDHYHRDQGDSSPQILVFYNKRLGWGFGMTTTTTTITPPLLKFRRTMNDNYDNNDNNDNNDNDVNQSFIKISDCKE